MKKAVKLFLIFTLSLTLVGVVLLPQVMNAPDADAVSPRQVEEPKDNPKPAQGVQVSLVRTGQLRVSQDFTGEVVTEANVEIIPDVGGKIVALPVQIGNYVVQGQTLIAEIDPSRPGTPFSKYRLLSSITGVVTSVSGQVGATISNTTPVVTVGNLEELRISVQVPETMIAGLQNGLPAEIKFSAYPGVSFPARIATINPVIDPASRTLKVNLKFTQHDEHIMPGLFAQVRVFLEPRALQVVVPQGTILAENGKDYVYLYSKGHAVRREVQTAKSAEGLTEVSKGLVAGELIVVAGQENLEDGMAISLLSNNQAGSQ